MESPSNQGGAHPHSGAVQKVRPPAGHASQPSAGSFQGPLPSRPPKAPSRASSGQAPYAPMATQGAAAPQPWRPPVNNARPLHAEADKSRPQAFGATNGAVRPPHGGRYNVAPAAQQGERKQASTRYPDSVLPSLAVTDARARPGGAAANPNQAGDRHQAVLRAQYAGAQAQSALPKFASNGVQPFRRQERGSIQPPEHTQRNRLPQLPSERHSAQSEPIEPGEGYVDNEVSHAARIDASAGRWPAEGTDTNDEQEGNAIYKVTEVYEPPPPPARQLASRTAAPRPLASHQQVRDEEQQASMSPRARYPHTSKPNEVDSEAQFERVQDRQAHARVGSGQGPPPNIKSSNSGHLARELQAAPQTLARVRHDLTIEHDHLGQAGYGDAEADIQLTSGSHFQAQRAEDRYRPGNPSTLRQATTASPPPSDTYMSQPHLKREPRDYANEEQSEAFGYDEQLEMELDEHGNFPGQLVDDFTDDVFSPPPTSLSAAGPVKMELVETGHIRDKGKKKLAPSVRLAPPPTPPAPFKCATNFASAEEFMSMIDMAALQKQVLQQLDGNESKGWELRAEMVITHQDKSDLVQRQFYSYQKKLNEIKKVKDKMLAEKRAITAKYEEAVDQAQEDMLGLTPGTKQYAKKRKLAKRTGSVAPRR